MNNSSEFELTSLDAGIETTLSYLTGTEYSFRCHHMPCLFCPENRGMRPSLIFD